MMKMMILAPRRTDMSHAEFRRYVTEIHGPLVKSVPEVARDIRHYHYNFPIHGAADAAFGHPLADHLDIVTQGWFDSREAQLANMAGPRYLEIVRPDEQRFAGAGAVMHYTAEAAVSDGGASVPAEKNFLLSPAAGRALPGGISSAMAHAILRRFVRQPRIVRDCA